MTMMSAVMLLSKAIDIAQLAYNQQRLAQASSGVVVLV